MNINLAAIAAMSACALVANTTLGGINSFIITNTNGDLYRVNGESLRATQISVLNVSGNINEILYNDDNSILYNDGARIIRHDLQTSQETLVFETRTLFDNGVSISAGLAHGLNGNLFYTTTHFTTDGTSGFAVTLDPISQNASLAIMNERPGFFDHHMISENVFISATWIRDEILFVNSVTGDIEDRFSVDISIVSFFEDSTGIFAMTKGGEIHTLDLTTRSLSYYGQINGTTGNLIGATIPTPSTMIPLVLTMLSTRRRRSNI